MEDRHNIAKSYISCLKGSFLLCFSFRDFMVDEEGRGTTEFKENNGERERNSSKQGLTASFNLFNFPSLSPIQLHFAYLLCSGDGVPCFLLSLHSKCIHLHKKRV